MEILLLILLLAIWLGCGVATAFIARNKGRSGCIWFAIGVILGVIGLVIALIIPSAKDG